MNATATKPITPADLIGDSWMHAPEACAEFNKLMKQGDAELKPVSDALIASTRLSEDDLAIRINARD